MANKEIANENMTIEVVSPASGEITVMSQPSINVKADNNGVYRGPLQFTAANITAPGLGTATPGTLPIGIIQPSAMHSKSDNLAVIRVGDRVDGLVSVGAMNQAGTSTVPCVITFSVEITDAGQTEVKGS